jgi:putative chitinase
LEGFRWRCWGITAFGYLEGSCSLSVFLSQLKKAIIVFGLIQIFSVQLLGNDTIEMNLTKEQIAQATGSSLENAEKFRPYLNKYMDKYGINTPERVLAFLAQIGTESGGLLWTREQGADSYFNRYEGRSDLGNIYVGDGLRFKGRGLIQLTGRANYQKMSEKIGKDIVSNPNLVEEPDLATEVSTIFWRDKVRDGLSLNQWADKFNLTRPIQDTANWEVHTNITKAINGGTNGIDDRANRLARGSQILEDIKKKVSSFRSSFSDKKNLWWLIPSMIIIFGSLTAVGIWFYRRKK